jgi:purine nucleosidase
MIEIIKSLPNECEVLCLGPLTNLAMAIRLDPSIIELTKKVCIMGGTNSAKGNDSSAAEFNFHIDPEAASIVFDSFADCE